MVLRDIEQKKGKIKSQEVLSISRDEGAKFDPYVGSTATNSRSVANRGKGLGWKPREEGLWDELEDDVDAILTEL